MRAQRLGLMLMIAAMSVYTLGQQAAPPKRSPKAAMGQGMQAPAHPMTVGRFYDIQAKEGQGKQLEEGIKRHLAFHREAGDKSQWIVWSFETGPEMGNYLVGTVGNQWADFEHMELGPKDEADVEANILPHVQHASSSIWTFRGDISPAPEGKPAKFDEVVHYALRAEGVHDFEEAIKQILAAMMKVPAEKRVGPPPMIYELRAGGKGPMMALVFARDSWGGFAPHGVNPMEALQEAYGPAKAQQIMQSAGKAIRYVETIVLRYRPELSSPLP